MPYSQQQRGPELTRTKTDIIRRRLVVSAHCLVLVLLIACGIQIYNLKDFGIREEAKAHEQSTERDRLLSIVRRSLAQSSWQARMFLISDRSERSPTYVKMLAARTEESNQAIAALDAMPELGSVVTSLKVPMQHHWAILDGLKGWHDTPKEKHQVEPVVGELNQQLEACQEGLQNVQTASQKILASGLAAIDEARRKRFEWLLISGRVTLLAGVVLTIYSLAYARDLERQRQARYDQLAAANVDLEKLSAHILHLQENERRHLSRELHDGIGQILTALRIEISRAQSHSLAAGQESSDGLQRARALAEDAVRNVRDISVMLRPTLLDDLGLEPALLWCADEFSRRTGIPCSCVVKAESVLADDWKTCVYRVVQEALHNSEKHAAPTRVQIAVLERASWLEVEIEDNGRGFDPGAKRTGGLGILGMRERAQILGGSLTVSSAPGRGTKVTLRLPLSRLPETLPPLPLGGSHFSAAETGVVKREQS